MALNGPKHGCISAIIVVLLLCVILSSGCISDPSKAKIIDVRKGAPAERHGLEKGMIVTRFIYTKNNNTTTREIDDYSRVGNIMRKDLSAGDPVTLIVKHDGHERRMNVTLGDRGDWTNRTEDMGKPYLGVEFGPTAGVLWSFGYLILYIILIVVMAVLIFSVVVVEKWISRRKARKREQNDGNMD